MASSTVVPAAPAAAAPAPSSPPAPSTPAPAPPASQPEGGAPPAAPAPPATPEGGAPPAAAAPAPGTVTGARPKPEDFPQTQEGLEQYIEANEKWKIEHPDEATAAAEAERAAAEAARPGAQPEEPKPAAQPEAPKPAEQQAAPATAATPQALDELLTRNPAFKAALDASPADKEILMATARAAEAAKPVLALVPTVEEAKFALDNANQFIGLQHKFAMAAEMPEVGEQAFNDFLSLFHVVDDKGQVVKLADGSPKMTESFDFLTQKLIGGGLGHEVATAKSTIATLKNQVEKGVYPSEAARAADRAKLEDAEYHLSAFDYVAKYLAAEGQGDALKLPPLPDDATPAQRELQEKLARQVEEANQQKKAGTKAERIAARTKFESDMNAEYGKGVGAYLRSEIDARKARGEYIPDLILNRKWINPVTRQETEASDFAVRMMHEFTQTIESIPSVKNELMRLQALGPAGKDARVAKWTALRAQYLPKIVDNYLKSVQDEVRQMAGQSNKREDKIAEIARVEPQTAAVPGAPPAPTGENLEARAMELLRDDPEFKQASRSEKFELLMNKKEEIRAGKVR